MTKATLSFIVLAVNVVIGGRKVPMDIVAVIKMVQGVSNIFSAIVIAPGYYAMVRATRKSIEEMRPNASPDAVPW